MNAARRPRLLVLGSGAQQVSLIRRAEERGIEVVVADYLTDSPGKAFATHSTLASAIDVAACIEVAEQFAIDGVMTMGTDMPVVTMAEVAAHLDLACYVTPETAKIATDKGLMDAVFAEAGVRRPNSLILGVGDPVALEGLRFPVVVKPVDSQGQRGVTLIEEPPAIADAVAEALSHSRSGSAIVEEFVTGPEITVSAWIESGEMRILAITDRVTYNPPPHLGIAYRHIFPTAHSAGVIAQAEDQTRAIARAYRMTDGPLYIQMVVAGSDVFVIEGAARVGGGHEAELIPLVSGFDVVDRLIGLALPAEDHQHNDSLPGAAAAVVTFLFAEDGIVADYGDTPPIADGLCRGGYYVGVGAQVKQPTNGTDRVGYVFCAGDSRDAALDASEVHISQLSLRDASGRSLLHRPQIEHVLSVD